MSDHHGCGVVVVVVLILTALASSLLLKNKKNRVGVDRGVASSIGGVEVGGDAGQRRRTFKRLRLNSGSAAGWCVQSCVLRVFVWLVLTQWQAKSGIRLWRMDGVISLYPPSLITPCHVPTHSNTPPQTYSLPLKCSPLDLSLLLTQNTGEWTWLHEQPQHSRYHRPARLLLLW